MTNLEQANKLLQEFIKASKFRIVGDAAVITDADMFERKFYDTSTMWKKDYHFKGIKIRYVVTLRDNGCWEQSYLWRPSWWTNGEQKEYPFVVDWDGTPDRQFGAELLDQVMKDEEDTDLRQHFGETVFKSEAEWDQYIKTALDKTVAAWKASDERRSQ